MKHAFYIAAILCLVACGKESHSREWYVQNDVAREARIRECQLDPMLYMEKDSDCRNASDADFVAKRLQKPGGAKAFALP